MDPKENTEKVPKRVPGEVVEVWSKVEEKTQFE